MDLGDRMKLYEKDSAKIFLPTLPIVVRVDGKCFSNWTRGLDRPYDLRFIHLMQEVTKFLVEETCANTGYCQSDEINLVFYSSNPKSQVFFNGKQQKMVSVIASMATAKFNSLVSEFLPDTENGLAFFDARAWVVPNLVEAANSILWRERDATKNSISMATREYYSHNEIFGKSCSEMQEMLFQKGVNWNDYPDSFKRGTFYQRKSIETRLTPEELDSLPEKHEARKNPHLTFSRSKVCRVDMPPFSSVLNRIGVVLYGEDPVVS